MGLAAVYEGRRRRRQAGGGEHARPRCRTEGEAPEGFGRACGSLGGAGMDAPEARQPAQPSCRKLAKAGAKLVWSWPKLIESWEQQGLFEKGNGEGVR